MFTALVARAQDNYADSVTSYNAGTGVSAAYKTSANALGAPITGLDGSTPYSITYPVYKGANMVGVGNGGELTVQFNTPITNDAADHAGGMDFTIFGNEFFVLGSGGALNGAFDHPGLTVWVSQDNVTYYELKAPNGYGADDSFPTNPVSQGGNPLIPVNPSLTLSGFNGLTAAQALTLYNGSAGGASFSISWAENADGTPADLSSISYIEVEGGSSGAGYVDAISRVEAIPEPSNLALVLLGGGCLVFVRRFGKGWRRSNKVVGGLLLGAAFMLTAKVSAQGQDFTLSDIQYWVGSGTNQCALVISWNDGVTPDSLVFGYNWNTPKSGDDPTVYDMMQAIQTADPLLSFTAHPRFNNPGGGDYALYSAFYNLTGKGGATVGTPGDLGGAEDGSAPAGDHYKEGWVINGFWGELEGIGDPYDGGSWTSAYPQVQGLAIDTLNNDSWYGLSFSTDETNFTISDPGFPTAVFPIPEPSSLWLCSLGAAGLFVFWKRRGISALCPR